MPQFAETTHAFEKGLTNVTPDAAIKLIDYWEEQTAELDSKEGKAIAKDLGALKRELAKGDKLDGDKVADLVSKLGQQTSAIAKTMEGPSADKVSTIGGSLSKAG